MSELALQLSFWIWAAYILMVCAGAFSVGGPSERLGAVAILGGWLATLVIVRVGTARYGAGVAVVDIIALALLVAIAMKSSRYWPLWAAGFHLLAVMTHWAHKLDPSVSNWTYVTAGIIWGYLLVGALAYGTWSVWRERRQMAMAAAPTAEPGATLL